MVNFKNKSIIFQGSRGGSTLSRGGGGGPTFSIFPGGGGPIAYLIPYRNPYITCDFPGGGGPDPLSPPPRLDPHLSTMGDLWVAKGPTFLRVEN